MSEHDEQVMLFQWAGMQVTKYPELVMLFAVPNGGYRAKFTAMKLKGEGVRPGIPDVWLPVPRGPYSGMVIEMKFGKNTLEKSQKGWLNILSVVGWSCHVCYCFEAARMAILWYLSQDAPPVVGGVVHVWKSEKAFNLEPIPDCMWVDGDIYYD